MPRAFATVAIGLVIALLLSLVLVPSDAYEWVAQSVEYAPGQESSARSKPPDVEITNVRDINSAGWLRAAVELPSGAGARAPLALFLSGPFSAEVTWDGLRLGMKGRPASEEEPEVPGPIDAVFYLPEALVSGGPHTLELRFSAENVGYAAENLFHTMAIGVYAGDPRRALRHYGLPILLSGSLVLLAMQFARMGLSGGSRSAWWLSAMAGSLLFQLMAEVSRSMASYTYQWHFWRSLAVWVCAVAAAYAIGALVVSRSDRLSRQWLWGCAALALLISFLASGFDGKTAAAVCTLALIPLAGALLEARTKQPDLLVVTAGCLAVCWWIGSLVSSVQFLDSTVYLTSTTWLAAAWLSMSRGSEPLERQAEPGQSPGHFLVRQTRGMVRVEADRILAIHAAGNFAELRNRDGETILHHLRLGEIMEQPPAGFVRVHRSHAINCAALVGIHSREGSRYFAELTDGSRVPVSRYRVAELRALLDVERTTEHETTTPPNGQT